MTTTHEPLLPTLFPKMKGFAGIPQEKFTEFKSKGTMHPLEKTASDKALAITVFMDIGSNWVEASTADVKGKTKLKSVRLKFQPGQTGFKLPGQVQGFKFSSEAPALKDLRLDDKPVIRGKAYSAEEAGRMVYTDKEPSKEISYIVGVPANPAKL